MGATDQKAKSEKKDFYLLPAMSKYTNSMHNSFLFRKSSGFKWLLTPDCTNSV